MSWEHLVVLLCGSQPPRPPLVTSLLGLCALAETVPRCGSLVLCDQQNSAEVMVCDLPGITAAASLLGHLLPGQLAAVLRGNPSSCLEKSTWEELRPRANSQGSEPPWRLIFQPQLSLPMRPWPQSIAGL